jgi:hypothetical protein
MTSTPSTRLAILSLSHQGTFSFSILSIFILSFSKLLATSSYLFLPTLEVSYYLSLLTGSTVQEHNTHLRRPHYSFSPTPISLYLYKSSGFRRFNMSQSSTIHASVPTLKTHSFYHNHPLPDGRDILYIKSMCKITEVRYSRCGHITTDPRSCKQARNLGWCSRKLKVIRFTWDRICVQCREQMVNDALRALELL